MPAERSWFEEAERFVPLNAAGRPIFRWDGDRYVLFYAPGYLGVVDRPAAERFQATIGPRGDGVGAELWCRAERAVAAAGRWQEEPFRPECLTLYMDNACNLRCLYCYSDPSPQAAAHLEQETIAAAAQVVAQNCQQKDRPFYVAFHGGGEPILNRARVERALVLLQRIAAAHGVEIFRYVASNGVMPEEKARWLARRFDLVGLSCDGPAAVQDRQRPRWNGAGTAGVVERTARILRQAGRRFHVRATITAATLYRQAEVAEYLCRELVPQEIRFEPVYLGGRAGPDAGLSAGQASEFVAHLLEAQEVARNYGVPLQASGSRPGEVHGAYCNVFRQVLNLVPGGVATACFKVTDAAQAAARGLAIGALDRATGRFPLDYARVEELRGRVTIPAGCAGCFNSYHCVRECPDRCLLSGDSPPQETAEPGFRCRVQKALAFAALWTAAEHLWAAAMDRAEEARERACGTAIL